MSDIPEVYKEGVALVESYNAPAMTNWLREELFDRHHLLAGQADDYPVQAILNHHTYLSMEAQVRIAQAIKNLIVEWKTSPEQWTDPAARALLSLATELPVPGAKPLLQSLAESAAFETVPKPLRAPVMRTIAGLSGNADRTFWTNLAAQHGEFAGMAFQVLTRTSQDAALALLGSLPHNQPVVDSVARSLPEFISRFPEETQFHKLEQVSEALALASMPAEFAARLVSAMKQAGYTIPESRLSKAAAQRRRFRKRTGEFALQITHRNSLEFEDARVR